MPFVKILDHWIEDKICYKLVENQNFRLINKKVVVEKQTFLGIFDSFLAITIFKIYLDF